MSLVTILLSPVIGLIGIVIAITYSHFITYSHLRKIPGPFAARFSNLWLLWTARLGKRSLLVDQAHRTYGPIVRVQPNHISINDDEAIQLIYGHGNGYLKSEFYDAFVSIQRGIFNTRSRAEHTRKRKIVSHTFSAKSISEFEPFIHDNLELFTAQWDKLCEATQETSNYAFINCLDWFNYLAFDVIGDLAFGASFGMLEAGADMAEVCESPTSPPIYAPAVDILNRRGEVSATLGCLPQLKPWARWLPDPFFSKGLNAVSNLAGMAIARVRRRFDQPDETEDEHRRKDLLARLMEGRDEKGEPLCREELTAEALTQLIAGSDTTSNTSCALLYYVSRTSGVAEKLREELRHAHISKDMSVPTYEAVKDLPYLQSVINETLRCHSTSGIGLPRVIPPDSSGIDIQGYHFPPGTTLSVPTYSVHHSKEIWGPDADEFKPERWASVTERQKNAFIPFSYGPRSCIGRNVADMELKLILATWVQRYDVVLVEKGEMKTREGFLRKPVELEIGLRRV